MKQSKDVVLAAVERDGLALNYAQSSMKDTQDVVLPAVTHGLALQYASDSKKSNKNVVLAAVKQDGLALQYASASMKDNQDVVLAAVKQTSKMVKFKVHMQLPL